MGESDTLRHLRQRVEHARHTEAKAFDAWLGSRGEERGVCEGFWCAWIVARRALDRAASMMRDEQADRARLEREQS